MGWVINRRRFYVTIALGLILLAAAAFVALVAIEWSDATCASQNRALDVVADIAVVQATGPHRFNQPSDVTRRLALLTDELGKVRAARCR